MLYIIYFILLYYYNSYIYIQNIFTYNIYNYYNPYIYGMFYLTYKRTYTDLRLNRLHRMFSMATSKPKLKRSQ